MKEKRLKAEEVGDIVGVSKRTVHQWIYYFNKQGILRRIGMRETEQKGTPDYDKGHIAEENEGHTAEEAIDLYLNNLELVKALAASYKFKYHFYWQPTIFGKNKLSEYEKAEYPTQQHLERFFKKTYDILSKKTVHLRDDKTFHDLSAIFSHVEEPVYIDWVHLSERGNATIAQAMVEHISHLIQSGADTAKEGG